jgi:hypothetical protein
MASFSFTKTPMTMGNKLAVLGVYTSSGGATGGDIKTGLQVVEGIFLQPKGSSVLANEPVVNETIPLRGGTVTIVTTANEVGSYMAVGY